ncbi:MAG: polysaccharide deacetylase family protein [Planctomycetota bacterium]
MIRITLILIASCISLGLLCYVLPLLIRAAQARRWRARGTGLLALTYDDGPDPTTTRAVLGLLAHHEAPATFYLVGFRADQNPDVCDEISAAGHELGSHTHRHRNAWKIGPIAELRDAHRGCRSLATWIPHDAPYRPPFGKTSLPTWLSMRLAGRRVDWWTVAAQDTGDAFPDPASFAKEILDTGGPVVLMHCHHNEPHRRVFVLALTEALIEGAKSRGVRLVTVSELEASCR